jgi:hypothetical protein
MWKSDAMSDQPSQDPYDQQPSGQPSQPAQPSPPPPPGAYQQAPPGPGYGQTYPAGYPAAPPRKPIDLAKLVGIAAWVVVGLFGLWYLYFIANDDNGGEFVDRFFGGMDRLGEGLFYAGALFAVSIWLGRNQAQ